MFVGTSIIETKYTLTKLASLAEASSLDTAAGKALEPEYLSGHIETAHLRQ